MDLIIKTHEFFSLHKNGFSKRGRLKYESSYEGYEVTKWEK